MQRKSLGAYILSSFILTFIGIPVPAAQPKTAEEPARLLLFITVDQLRYDYLQRLETDFNGGLARLLRQGARFDQAFQAHAVTTTGPGHASLATGVYPSHSGIVNNQWFDRRTQAWVNCVSDGEAQTLDSSLPGRSPRNLLVNTLADWIRRSYPEAKIFAASRKDRGAILAAGHGADGAFWYDSRQGRFVTSRYYMDQAPAWLASFHATWGPERYFGQAWEPLPVSQGVVRRGKFQSLDLGDFTDGFPHPLGGLSLTPDSGFFSDFGATPLMDRFLAEFVERLVVEEGLGTDDQVDFLGVSFSALDSAGHQFGPNSPEVLDTLLQLDATLGQLLDFLDERVGKGRYLVSLSADHGVVPLPEYQAVNQLPGARVSTPDVLCVQQAGLALQQRLGVEPWFVAPGYLDYENLGRLDLRRSEVEQLLARELEECSAVERVWTRTQLSSEEPPASDFERLYRNSFYSDRSPDLAIQWREFWLSYSGRGTSHGSPYEYDRHVPLIIAGPGIAAQRLQKRVETVDLAPTLANLLGVTPDPGLDGQDRSQALAPAAGPPATGGPPR